MNETLVFDVDHRFTYTVLSTTRASMPPGRALQANSTRATRRRWTRRRLPVILAARAAASRVAREPRLRSSCDVLIAAFRCNITYQPPPSRSPRRSSILPFLRRARRGPRRWLRLGPEGDKLPRDVFKRVPAPDFYLQIPPNRIAILCGSDRQNENRRRHFCKVPLVVKFPSKQLRIWIAIKFLGRFQTSDQSCGSVIYIY